MRALAVIPISLFLLQAQDPVTPIKKPPSMARQDEQLSIPFVPQAASQAAPEELTSRSVAQPRTAPGTPALYFYAEGTPGCEHAYLNGRYWQSIIAGDVAVAASPRDNGKKLIISVLVINRGKRPIDVLPSHVAARIVQPKVLDLKWADPANIAKSIQRKARWTSAFEQMGANMQTQQVQTQANTSGQLNTNTDYYGDYGQRVGSGRGSGSYNEQTTVTTTMPNWAAQQQAQANIQRRMANANDAVQAIAIHSLKSQTLSEGQVALGDVYFDRDRAVGKKHLMAFRIGVADSNFEFHFARQ